MVGRLGERRTAVRAFLHRWYAETRFVTATTYVTIRVETFYAPRSIPLSEVIADREDSFDDLLDELTTQTQLRAAPSIPRAQLLTSSRSQA